MNSEIRALRNDVTALAAGAKMIACHPVTVCTVCRSDRPPVLATYIEAGRRIVAEPLHLVCEICGADDRETVTPHVVGAA